MAKIVIRNLTKTYSGGVVVALQDINLQVAPNESLCVLGPSGCGKTTLLRIIDCLIGRDHGDVLIDGELVTQPRPDVAVVFQHFGLFPWKRLEENIAYGLELRGKSREDISALVKHYVTLIGLRGFEKSLRSELIRATSSLETPSGKCSNRNKSKILQEKSLMSRRAKVRLLSLVIVLGLWEYYGRRVNPILFTYPLAIARAFIDLVLSGELQSYMKDSLLVLLYASVLSVLVGVFLGVVMGRYALVEWATEIYINALYSMPMVAMVPLIVLWFGFKVPAKVIIVFLFMVFPILINTYQGVKDVDRNLQEVARSFCSSEPQLWRHLIIPSALPFIVVGIRLAIGRGLVGMIVAEFYTSVTGLGYMIVRYANAFETDKLFVPIVVVMILGVGLMSLAKWIEGRIAPWRNFDDRE